MPRVPAVCLVALVACEGPLPPETPKTEVDQRAEVMPIIEDVPPTESSTATPSPVVVFHEIGLKTPESVLYDPTRDRYIVSNIQGSPDGKDNDGFLSKLSPDGSVEALEWIRGGKDGVTLNAPKGSALANGKLWVSDVDHVRRFDAVTGKPEKSIEVPGATFLNDVAVAPDGTVFVSDSGVKVGKSGFEPTGVDAIYQIVKDKPVAVAKNANLGQPNGLLVDAERILYVTLSGNTLRELDRSGKDLRRAESPTGGLDGLVRLGSDDFLLSSWEGSALYRGGFDAKLSLALDETTSPADIGFDSKRNRVLIPIFTGDEVRVFDLAALQGAPSPAPSSTTPSSTTPSSTTPSAAPPPSATTPSAAPPPSAATPSAAPPPSAAKRSAAPTAKPPASSPPAPAPKPSH